MQKFFRIVAILSMVMGVSTVHGASAEGDKDPTPPTSSGSGSSATVFFDKQDMARVVKLYGPGISEYGAEHPAWILNNWKFLERAIQKLYEEKFRDFTPSRDIGIIARGKDAGGERITEANLAVLYEDARTPREVLLNVTISSRVFGSTLRGDGIFFDPKDLSSNVCITGPGIHELNCRTWVLRGWEVLYPEIFKEYKSKGYEIKAFDIGPIRASAGEEISPDGDLTPLYVRARSGKVTLNLTIAAHVFGAKF
jgi:hypothetical protein